MVGGVVGGAGADVLRAVTRSLGELAYQRGGVVIALDDDALVVAFGLEVAGEDDVAIAMGWALDAAAMARDAGGSLRIGARTGVASAHDSGIAKESIDEARAIAKDAAPDRPMKPTPLALWRYRSYRIDPTRTAPYWVSPTGPENRCG